MNHQDWNNVVLNTNKKVVKEIVERKKINNNPSIKLNENDEVIQIKKVPKDISHLITNARIANKYSRKDLANKLNVKEDIIADIENGKAIYDGNMISKIKRILHLNK